MYSVIFVEKCIYISCVFIVTLFRLLKKEEDVVIIPKLQENFMSDQLFSLFNQVKSAVVQNITFSTKKY